MKRLMAIVVLFAIALPVAACGASEPEPTETEEPTPTVTLSPELKKSIADTYEVLGYYAKVHERVSEAVSQHYSPDGTVYSTLTSNTGKLMFMEDAVSASNRLVQNTYSVMGIFNMAMMEERDLSLAELVMLHILMENLKDIGKEVGVRFD
ncbi:MAG TPA: hypothetical protein GX728_00830 [Clostridiaceae bacterium]|nr:hypothetical protein [Clostridiaceae bacterium]